tara:strand:+ start:376 stop:1344 length:969 start_codon:yes stop_codon:yes gene_type:complete
MEKKMRKDKIRKIIKEQIVKLKEQLGPRMKSPRPTGPSDDRRSKDNQLSRLLQISKFANVQMGEDKLYKLAMAWEEWNVDNDDKYDDLVDPLFAAVEMVQDNTAAGMKRANGILKSFNRDIVKVMNGQNEGTDAISTARSLPTEMYNRGPVSIDEKEVDVDSIEMEGMDWRGGHDDGTTDRYIAAASFKDGTSLTDDQRDRFLEKYPELTQELAVQQMEEAQTGTVHVGNVQQDDDKKDWTPEDHEEEEEYQKHFKLEELAKALGYLKENHANQKYYKFLNVLKDKGHLHRYGVTQLQTEFGLKEKEAQEIYNQYKKDLKDD